MLAVDTNVLVRFLTADDAAQFARAEALIASNDVRILTTVLLETRWVLRATYKLNNSEITQAFRNLVRLPTVALEDEALVHEALDLAERGMDFADALHLAAASDAAFVTFDRDLLRMARREGRDVRAP